MSVDWTRYVDLAWEALNGSVPADVMLEQVDASIAWTEEQAEAFNERMAIQREALDDGLTTTQRALNALQVPDTPWGAHACARAWLRDMEPMAGIFRKVSE